MKTLRNIAVGAMIIALLTLIPPQWGRVGRWLLLGIFLLCVAGAAIKLLLRHQARITRICTSLGKLVPKMPSFKWTGTPMGVIRYAAIIPLVVLAIVVLANWPLELGRAQDIPWWVLPAAWLALVVLAIYFLVPNEGGRGVKIRAKVAQWCAVVIIAATIHAWWERPRPWLPSHFVQIPRPIMLQAVETDESKPEAVVVTVTEPPKAKEPKWEMVLYSSRLVDKIEGDKKVAEIIADRRYKLEGFTPDENTLRFVAWRENRPAIELRAIKNHGKQFTGTAQACAGGGTHRIVMDYDELTHKFMGQWQASEIDNEWGRFEIYSVP